MYKAIFEFRNKLTNVIHFVCVIKLSVRPLARLLQRCRWIRRALLTMMFILACWFHWNYALCSSVMMDPQLKPEAFPSQPRQQQRRVCHNLETDDSTINFRRYSSGPFSAELPSGKPLQPTRKSINHSHNNGKSTRTTLLVSRWSVDELRSKFSLTGRKNHQVWSGVRKKCSSVVCRRTNTLL